MRSILVLFLAVMLMGLMSMFSTVRADEVVVPDGDKIHDFIMGDTTSTGERNVPGRIYKLERGKIYILTEPLEIDFDFYLVAADDDPDNPVRPPMLVMGFFPDGSVIGNEVNITGDDIEVVFRNVLFQGVPLDRNYRNDWFIGISGSGSNVRLKFDKCVFNGWNYAATDLPMNNIKLYVTDCIFRNLVQPVHPFGGQSIATWGAVDTLVYVNNTFFNTSAYIVLPEPGRPCNYIKFDHNTIYTTMINPFYVPTIYNAEFTNNIFYGVLAFGQSHDEILEGWYGWGGMPVGIMNYDTLGSQLESELGVTESERKIIHKNNAWFNPQKIVDYWQAYKDSVPVVDANGDTTGWTVQPLTGTVWMNENTQAMFNNKTKYPNFIDENTMYVDPQFDSSVEIVVDSVVAWAEWWRSGLGWDSESGPIRQYPFSGDIFNLPWPLPENLAYTNETLKTAGTKGFPLGDLNWFPDKKKEWELTTIDEGQNYRSLPIKFTLGQNYPNPFNPTTVIPFNLTKRAHVKITIYDILGKKVATALDKMVNSGAHEITFDGTNLANGIYYYQLSSGTTQITKKMVLLK